MFSVLCLGVGFVIGWRLGRRWRANRVAGVYALGFDDGAWRGHGRRERSAQRAVAP